MSLVPRIETMRLSCLMLLLTLGACSPLTAFNALTPMDPSRVAAHDVAYGPGPRQRLDVYVPPGKPAEPAPVLIFFYGGGWSDGHREHYKFAGRALASRGFVTLVPDYRIYPQVRYPSFLEDAAAAVRWAKDHAAEYGGDPRRIVLAGHSAGAYNAVMLGLDTSYLQAAGVDPRTIKAVVGLSGPYDFAPFRARSAINAFGQASDPAATQPINHARANAPPMLLIQGLADRIVEPRNTRSLAAALEKVGAPVEVRLHEKLDHADPVKALSLPFRRKAPVLDEMADFAHRHAGDKPGV